MIHMVVVKSVQFPPVPYTPSPLGRGNYQGVGGVPGGRSMAAAAVGCAC
jgi:hypothetical protein